LNGLHNKTDTSEIRYALRQLKGISREVASAIALYSMDCADSIPINMEVFFEAKKHAKVDPYMPE